MRLKNDNLVALNVFLYGSNLELQTLNQNTQLETLPSPPKNSSLFIYSSNLYAFQANTLSPSRSQLCSDGSFQLYMLNSTSKSWTLFAPVSFSGVLDTSFYRDALYLVAPGSSSVYIYGGLCSSGAITDRLLSFNMETKTFYNVSTSTRPKAFYGAVSLWIPSTQSLVIIGGKSPMGWLNMHQLATWNFQSGWLFQEASHSGQNSVDSRTSPLVLPIFSPSAATSAQEFLNYYSPTSALVIGGQGHTTLQNEWAEVSFGSPKWSWTRFQPSIDELKLMGGFVVFHTFVAVYSSTKRDGSYTLSLYDLSDNFRPISDLKSSQALQESSQPSNSNKTVKILMGVLVPLAILAIIAAVVMYLWRQKVSTNEQQSIIEAIDYQFGHFRNALDRPYSLSENLPLDLYAINDNDTASTLETNSINLWVRKRQAYDAKRNSGELRQSFLASNETLNSSGYTTLNEQISDKLHSDNASNETLNLKTPASLPVHFLEAAIKRRLEDASAAPRLAQLKTVSFAIRTPGLPISRNKYVLDLGLKSCDNHAECESVETDMDVQVLVSSKRKSTLRVMNPDQENDTIRQRQSS